MIVSDVLPGALTLCLLTVHNASLVWIVFLVGFLISCSAQFFSTARGTALDTFLQLAVPDRKLGRMDSVIKAACSSTGLVAMYLAAQFGDIIGLAVVFLVLGSFGLASRLLGFRLLRLPKEECVWKKKLTKTETTRSKRKLICKLVSGGFFGFRIML